MNGYRWTPSGMADSLFEGEWVSVKEHERVVAYAVALEQAIRAVRKQDIEDGSPAATLIDTALAQRPLPAEQKSKGPWGGKAPGDPGMPAPIPVDGPRLGLVGGWCPECRRTETHAAGCSVYAHEIFCQPGKPE